MWPDCSPPRLKPWVAHVLEHIAVADGGADEIEAEAAEKALETEIGHDGGDDAGLRQAAVLLP